MSAAKKMSKNVHSFPIKQYWNGFVSIVSRFLVAILREKIVSFFKAKTSLDVEFEHQ